MKKRVIILAAVIAAAVSGCGGNIDVSVDKSSGGAGSSMQVTLSGEGKSLTSYTNLKGETSFDDLDYGTYTITCAGGTDYNSATDSAKLTIWDQWFGGGKSVDLVVGKK
mgnify:CR=1 FL=1